MECSAQNQMNKSDFGLFNAYCQEAMAPFPDMAYYNCVALCAMDAVFSIRTKYSTVSRILNRFCEHYQIQLVAETPYSMPAQDRQMTVSELIELIGDINAEELAAIVQNHQWTTARGRNRILKAEAFLRYIEVFRSHNIDTFQDVNAAFEEGDSLKNALKSIPGQNVAVDYFFMLAGDENGVKVDTHIRNFAENAVGHPLSNDEIKELFSEEVAYLRQHGNPDMTVRHLDHIVWSWQRSR